MRGAVFTFFSIIIALQSCIQSGGGNYNDAFRSPQQREYSNMIIQNEDSISKAGNDIQKKEIQNAFDKKLLSFIDSTKVFINWEGKISSIQTLERVIDRKKFTEISFRIEFNPKQNIESNFECSIWRLTDSLQNDYIYNKIRNITNHSTVYFDGIIKKKDAEIYYYPTVSNKESYPRYYFEIIDINTNSQNYALSSNLQRLIDIDYSILDSMDKNYKRNPSIWNKFADKHKVEIDSLLNTLNDDERAYHNRLFNFLINEWVENGK